jgi:hypothetical protein
MEEAKRLFIWKLGWPTQQDSLLVSEISLSR